MLHILPREIIIKIYTMVDDELSRFVLSNVSYLFKDIYEKIILKKNYLLKYEEYNINFAIEMIIKYTNINSFLHEINYNNYIIFVKMNNNYIEFRKSDYFVEILMKINDNKKEFALLNSSIIPYIKSKKFKSFVEVINEINKLL